MTGEMKQRIVGIVVLIFLALIILPWLFGSNQPVASEENKVIEKEKWASDDMQGIAKGSQDIKPVPDLIQESPKGPIANNHQDEPLSSKISDYSSEGATSQSTDRTTASANSHQAIPVEPTLTASKMATIENRIVHTQVTKKSILKESPKDTKTKLKSLAEKKPIKLPELVKKTSTTQIAEKAWVIQLGAFSNKVNAEKLVHDLKASGYLVSTKKSKNTAGEEVTRVFIGAQDRSAAENAVIKIDKNFHVHGVVMKAGV